ncbi:MAG: site-2 protease family protein [Clostridia bacterium]|nr:site-2 protease family protein [Clostridia bacterium]
MLLDLLTQGLSLQEMLIQILLTIPTIFIALTFHEVAHGWMSYKLGDPTAYNMGRLTLNPLKHLDPIGALCMLLVGFGWAKPVPVNARYYKNPKRGMALTAFAGPAMNLILAFFGVIIYRLINRFGYLLIPNGLLVFVLFTLFYYFAYLNIFLAVFNLIPIPPFDGSRIAYVFLPTNLYFKIMRYERIIQIIVMVALVSGIVSLPLGFIADGIQYAMEWLIGLVI